MSQESVNKAILVGSLAVAAAGATFSFLFGKGVENDSGKVPEEHVDVLVVGYGCAGAVAAVQAVESLRSSTSNIDDVKNKVLIVDRFEGGGATSRSGGIIYLGGGTDVQKKLGVNDSVQNMFNYLKMETRGAVSDETLWRFCATSPDCAAWLRDSCGVSINIPDESAVLCPFKTSNAPDHYSVFYSGSETCYPFTTTATPAPRGHKIIGPGNLVGTGNVLFDNLDKRVRQLEAEKMLRVSTYTKVVNLIWDDNSTKPTVIGAEILSMNEAPLLIRVIYKLLAFYGSLTNPFPFLDKFIIYFTNFLESTYGKRCKIFAHKGVILSAGGFCRSQELIQKHTPKFAGLMPIGSAGDDGHGIFELGIKQAKAKAKHLDQSSCWKFITPPQAFPKGVLVSEEGKRMINEDVYGARLGEEIIVNNGGKGWLIVDEKIAEESIHEVYNGEMLYFQMAFTQLNLKWNCVKAGSLEELASKCGFNSSTFLSTMEQYNKGSRNGVDEQFKKHPSKLAVIDKAPFYAINLSAKGTWFPSPSFTLGGLEVDEETGLVISATSNEPIQGLYAAGRNASGVCSKSYVSGLSLADCVFSGRRAGLHIVSGEVFGKSTDREVSIEDKTEGVIFERKESITTLSMSPANAVKNRL